MNLNQLQEAVERHFAAGPAAVGDAAALAVFHEFRAALERGEIRSASPDPDSPAGWKVNVWVKQGILLGFRLGVLEDFSSGNFSLVDKSTFPPRRLGVGDGVRVVPGGSTIRTGTRVNCPPCSISMAAWETGWSVCRTNCALLPA